MWLLPGGGSRRPVQPRRPEGVPRPARLPDPGRGDPVPHAAVRVRPGRLRRAAVRRGPKAGGRPITKHAGKVKGQFGTVWSAIGTYALAALNVEGKPGRSRLGPVGDGDRHGGHRPGRGEDQERHPAPSGAARGRVHAGAGRRLPAPSTRTTGWRCRSPRPDRAARRPRSGTSGGEEPRRPSPTTRSAASSALLRRHRVGRAVPGAPPP
jgi:hypothetical protein